VRYVFIPYLPSITPPPPPPQPTLTPPQAADSALVCSLTNGILRDRDGRTGSVVANRQFQFDGPPQAGAIYTGGFAVCSNGSLAIGGSTRWWQCSSGPFYNLYDEWIGAQCEEIRIQVTFPEKQVSSSAVMSSVAVASSSVPVATVQSSLATITGAVSTVSKSAIGPSASFASSASSNASMPSGSASGSTAASGSVSATRSGSSAPSGSSTGAPAAPAAGGAAPVSFGVARGSMAAAFVVIFGAALIL
jgi:hypothetical protein